MSDLLAGYTAVMTAVADAATAAGRRPSDVTVVAASKGQGPDAIAALYAAGHRDFGENYVAEWKAKRAALQVSCPALRWHFIGRVQSGNAKEIVRSAAVHGLGSIGAARALEQRADAVLPVFLQVNPSHEETKNGFDPKELRDVISLISEMHHLEIAGLMVLPPPEADPRAAFAEARALRDLHLPGAGLSMGMSGDFAAAIAEGSTVVRVGTAIFGARPRREE